MVGKFGAAATEPLTPYIKVINFPRFLTQAVLDGTNRGKQWPSPHEEPVATTWQRRAGAAAEQLQREGHQHHHYEL